MTVAVLAHSDLLEAHSPAPQWFRDAVLAKCADTPWHRYPEPAEALREKVAAHYGVGAGNVLITRGCTEAVGLAFDWVATRAEPLALPTPSWPGFAHLAEQRGLAWTSYPAGDGLPRNGIPVVCSPNNPTGDVVAPADLRTDRPVVVDCTYDDVADAPLLPGVAQYLDGQRVFCVNLGKATGLSGARLGLVLADADVVGELAALTDPYRLDVFQLAVLDTLFTDRGVRMWRAAVDRARADGVRCSELLTSCVRVTALLGHVVYGEYDERCEHVDALVAATGAALFPVERRFRVRATPSVLASLERIR